jgi:hypothetical protein
MGHGSVEYEGEAENFLAESFKIVAFSRATSVPGSPVFISYLVEINCI